MRISKRFMMLAGILLFVILSIAAIGPGKDQPKNLKVLPTNISDDALIKIMENFEKSLGVKCGFCHVMKDSAGLENYASDALRSKEITRNMMRMTFNINNHYFRKDSIAVALRPVGCLTCHRGQREPRYNEPEVKKNPFDIKAD